MVKTLDEIDGWLLTLIQKQIPLIPRPFEAMAAALGISETEVLSRFSQLKARPGAVIRQTSAIFDTKTLGYDSSLVAARIDPARLERAAAAINLHPGVTHNYERNHPFNLWYTVAVPPDSRLGLNKTVELLHQLSGAKATRLFPTLKLYKIGVSFDLSGSADAAATSASPAFSEEDRQHAMTFAITDADKRMIRVLQQDLPIVERPFDAWAEQAGVSVEELLTAAQTYLDQKRMRRFAAVLHHRQAGVSANAMGAWAVPPEQQDQFGALAANYSAVSHCYLRPVYEDWPYCIFTMVHGQKAEDCTAVLSEISRASGISEYVALYSTREFKKIRLKYFTGEIEAWEQTAGA
jgi:DNA-binding Lrp family transcriptional regulator